MDGMPKIAGADVSKDFMTGAAAAVGVIVVLLLFGFALGRR